MVRAPARSYTAAARLALETALTAVVELPQDEGLWARAEKLRARSIASLVAVAYRG